MSKIYCTKIYHTIADGASSVIQSPADYIPNGKEEELNYKWDLEHIEFRQAEPNTRYYHVITLWSREEKKDSEETTTVLEKNFPLTPMISAAPSDVMKKSGWFSDEQILYIGLAMFAVLVGIAGIVDIVSSHELAMARMRMQETCKCQ